MPARRAACAAAGARRAGRRRSMARARTIRRGHIAATCTHRRCGRALGRPGRSIPWCSRIGSSSGSSRTARAPCRGRGHEATEPVFLLGADRTGRDVFSRVLAGARVSLGARHAVGAWGDGARGGARRRGRLRVAGWTDEAVMRRRGLRPDPAGALRGVRPACGPAARARAGHRVSADARRSSSLVGWPIVARGVRALVARERAAEYVVAARAAGAGSGARSLAAPAAGMRRPHGRAGQPAAAGVHPGGGDAVVPGPGLSRHGTDLGHDAARGRGHQRTVALPVDRSPRRRRFSWSRWPPMPRCSPSSRSQIIRSDRQITVRSPDRQITRSPAKIDTITRSPHHEILRTLPPPGHAVHRCRRRRHRPRSRATRRSI